MNQKFDTIDNLIRSIDQQTMAKASDKMLKALLIDCKQDLEFYVQQVLKADKPVEDLREFLLEKYGPKGAEAYDCHMLKYFAILEATGWTRGEYLKALEAKD